jgi:hypothetical protein
VRGEPSTVSTQNSELDRRVERFRALGNGTTLAAALSFYDSLPAVRVEEMLGSWHGSSLPTGNPLAGLLERFGWYGKRFDDAETVYPLVFGRGDGSLYAVNPWFVPMGLVMRFASQLNRPVGAKLFAALRPLIRTTKPHARLRLTEYRGVVSATMCYDALPVNDVFRKVDDRTLMGVMDLRGMTTPFVFVLRRDASVATVQGLR